MYKYFDGIKKRNKTKKILFEKDKERNNYINKKIKKLQRINKIFSKDKTKIYIQYYLILIFILNLFPNIISEEFNLRKLINIYDNNNY